MRSAAESLPDDLDELKEMVLQQHKEIFLQKEKFDHQSDYIHQLIEAIKLARHQHFGTRSEKFNGEQLSLLFNEAETLIDHEGDEQDEDDNSEEETTPVGPYKRRKGGRKKLPDHFHVLMWFTFWKNLIATAITARENWPRWAKRSANRLTWRH